MGDAFLHLQICRALGRAFSAICVPINQKTNASRDVFFDRAFRQSHLMRNLALGMTVYPAKDEGLARLAGHGGDRFSQSPQLVTIYERLFKRSRPIDRIEPVHFLDRLDRYHLGSSNVAHDDRMGDLENVGAGVLYVAHVFARGQNGIGFLDNVVDIDARVAFSREPAPQSRLVRQNMAAKPPRLLFCENEHCSRAPEAGSVDDGFYDDVTDP